MGGLEAETQTNYLIAHDQYEPAAADRVVYAAQQRRAVLHS